MGLKERDYEIRTGNSRRERHYFFAKTDPSAPDSPGNRTELDVSTYTFVSVIHKVGDPSTVYATLTITRPANHAIETFVSLAQVAALPTGVRAFQHYSRYTTPGGDTVTFDAGGVALMRGG